MGGGKWTADKGRCVRLLGAAPSVVVALAIVGCGGGGTTNSEGPRTSEGTKTTAQAQEAEHGARVFSSAGCGSCHAFKVAGSKGTTGPDLDEYLEPDDNQAGIEEMIVDPNAEIAEGYKADVMPKTFGESLSPKEVKQLVAFLYENSPASETSTGEQGEREEEGK